MKLEDIEKALAKFRGHAQVEPECRLHNGFRASRLEFFAPPVGTVLIGDGDTDKDLRVEGGNVVFSQLKDVPWENLTKGRQVDHIIEETTFEPEKVSYIKITYWEKNP